MHLVWFRCGADQSHVGQERAEARVPSANPAFPSRKSTALSNPASALENAGPQHPLHPPNATPASLTRTTAVPTSHSPLTRRTCLKWVILSRGEIELWAFGPFSPRLQTSSPPFSNSALSSGAWKIRFSSSRRRRSSRVKFSRLAQLCCHVQTLFFCSCWKNARNTYCTISFGSVSFSKPRHSRANIP